MIVVVVALSYPALVLVSWFSGDAITRANIETGFLLRTHQVVGRSEAVRAWLVASHGEAPSSAVMFTFISWALEHPDESEDLLSALPEHELTRLAARLAWAAVDSGSDEQFVEKFAASESAVLNHAADRIVRQDFRW